MYKQSSEMFFFVLSRKWRGSYPCMLGAIVTAFVSVDRHILDVVAVIGRGTVAENNFITSTIYMKIQYLLRL